MPPTYRGRVMIPENVSPCVRDRRQRRSCPSTCAGETSVMARKPHVPDAPEAKCDIRLPRIRLRWKLRMPRQGRGPALRVLLAEESGTSACAGAGLRCRASPRRAGLTHRVQSRATILSGSARVQYFHYRRQSWFARNSKTQQQTGESELEYLQVQRGERRGQSGTRSKSKKCFSW